MKKISKNSIPRKNAPERNDFFYRNIGDEFIIQGTHVLYKFGEIEQTIFQMINGENNIEFIVDNLYNKYQSNKENIYKDLLVFLEDLKKKKIISFKY